MSKTVLVSGKEMVKGIGLGEYQDIRVERNMGEGTMIVSATGPGGLRVLSGIGALYLPQIKNYFQNK